MALTTAFALLTQAFSMLSARRRLPWANPFAAWFTPETRVTVIHAGEHS